MPEVTLHYGTIVVAALANFAIGALWYSPVLFGNKWMQLVGKKKEEMKSSDAAKFLVVPLVMALISSYVLAHVIGYAQVDTFMEGVQTGFWVWLGFVATVMVVQTAFGNRSWKLWCLDASYQLVGYVVMGVILAMWK